LIRKRLVAGLFSLLPLGITVWFLKIVFQVLIGIFRAPLVWAAGKLGIDHLANWLQAAFSLLALVILLFAVGTLVQNYMGRRIFGWLDALMMNIPWVKGVYGAIKQVMGAIQSGQGGSFRDVVTVRWPGSDYRLIGFVSSRNCAWAVEGSEGYISVYIPTSPNPTTGVVLMVKESETTKLDMTPEQALTWVVSSGVAIPQAPRNGAP
jgi:uncharacterized membrane protein